MKRSFTALVAALACSAGVVHAAPGDPRIVQGTLEWPPALTAEPFVVIRGEDGRVYYADLSTAQRRGAAGLTVGARVAALGVEGNQPHELAALAFGAGDAATLGLPGAPPPAAALPSPVPAPGPGVEPMWRLDGHVRSVAGATVTLRTDEGQTHAVDATSLSTATLRALRPGDRITLFGVVRGDERLVANGYIQTEPSTPAASPPSPR
jgi:hypothetical protein